MNEPPERTIDDVPIMESFELLFGIVEQSNDKIRDISPVSKMVVGACEMHLKRCREYLAGLEMEQ